MPPSGYNTTQIASLSSFLRLCSEALESESKANGLTPDEGLQKEIEEIRSGKPLFADGKFSAIILDFTESFYREVLSRHPVEFGAFRANVTDVLSVMEDELLAIHIQSIAHSSSESR